jgi:hypothetical protein
VNLADARTLVNASSGGGDVPIFVRIAAMLRVLTEIIERIPVLCDP